MIGDNNYLNIRDGRSKWKGRTGARRGFVCFSSAVMGYRAAWILMNNYYRLHHCTTLSSIIHRFAPPGDGNQTDKYVHDVAHYLVRHGLGAFHSAAQTANSVLPPPTDDFPLWQHILTIMTIIESGIAEQEVDQPAIAHAFRLAFGRKPCGKEEEEGEAP